MNVLLVVVLSVLPVAFVIAYLRIRSERHYAETSATIAVTVDEFGVRRDLVDGRREEIDWGEVREVVVFVADRGPYASAGGAVVLFGDAERGCVVPFDHLEASGLIVALGRLPGFDTRRLVDGMAGKSHRTVTCWQRSTA